MGYDLYINGIEPVTDEKRLALQAVRIACDNADIDEPEEVSKVLDAEDRCDRGHVVKIDVEEHTEYNGEYCQYVDITKLPPGVKWIRLWHSY